MSSISRKKKHRKKALAGYEEPELNVMPFIDVFGLLTTYLLFSAVFVSVGIHEVQIPFFSNASPPKESPQRSVSLKVEVEKEKIFLRTTWSPGPENPESFEYPNTKEGAAQLHDQLIRLKSQNPDTDLVTLFTEDDVTWSELNAVLDAVKLRWENDPVLPAAGNEPRDATNLYRKVVMGSVIL